MSKSSFMSKLIVSKDDASSTWTIEEPFDYYSELAETVFHIPVGMVTDFASIPRILWNILPPAEGPYAKAAVVHDFLYAHKGKIYGQKLDRGTCDRILLEAMEVSRTGWMQRHSIYRAVRMFGWAVWKNKPDNNPATLEVT